MKILYLTERFAPFVGGIETMSMHLLSALKNAGHELHIVTSQCAIPMKDKDDWQGIALTRLPMLTSLSNRDVRGILQTRADMRAIKQEFQPDIVHIQFSGPSGMFHWDTQDGGKIPTLVTVHSVAGQVINDRSLYLDTLRKADWAAPVSRHMLDWTLQYAPEIADRSSVVYNGIPGDELPAEPRPLAFDPPTILWIGRMVDWKRADRLIDAFALLAKSDDQTRLCLAGDGPDRKRLEARVTQHRLSGRVDFTGWIDAEKRSKMLGRSTMVVIPSDPMENLPMVALETAGHGRPIIGSRVSGLPEIVEDGRTGVLLDDPNPMPLVQAIADLLDNPGKAAEMGRAASDIVRSRFTSQRMVADYITLYERLIHSAG